MTWYGLRLGMTLRETMATPMATMYDLIAIEQIKAEGWRFVDPNPDFEEELDALLALT